MGDYESRLMDIQYDIHNLIERINKCDPSLCSENWFGMTYEFDMEILKYVYQSIEVDEMFDVVTNIICAERKRMELEGKIEPYPSFDENGPLPEEPRSTLEFYATGKRMLLAAKREEQEMRERYTSQLMERKCVEWITDQNAEVTFFSDGTPDVEEDENRLADETENALREKDVLLRRLGEKEEEIKILKERYDTPREPEKAFNTHSNLSCFTSRQMGILLAAVGIITEKENPPGKTTLGEVVERIAGYRATTVNQNMKGAISEKDKKAVADAIESKLPNLAAKVRKL